MASRTDIADPPAPLPPLIPPDAAPPRLEGFPADPPGERDGRIADPPTEDLPDPSPQGRPAEPRDWRDSIYNSDKDGSEPPGKPPAPYSKTNIPKPDQAVLGSDKARAEFEAWWVREGYLRAEQRDKDPHTPVAPSESHFWKSREKTTRIGKLDTRKSADGTLIYQWDRGGAGRHQSEIEVYRKRGNKAYHEGTLDPLTGTWKTETDPKTGKQRTKRNPKRWLDLSFYDQDGRSRVV
ncbi:hypothetical protein SAMN05421742_10978 [Roseospirillum parvum]|uniref:Uncharacterized protein n=1 Tax=Roseospirillum parvum TaxID=83401 RepID=A0A1G8E9E3_9PROT|nr:hypothetical protein SAMN05421742_10978 [Roseospirillum parvum]